MQGTVSDAHVFSPSSFFMIKTGGKLNDMDAAATRALVADAAEFRFKISGTENAYLTVRTGDIVSYEIPSKQKNRIGVFTETGFILPLCRRDEALEEYYIDPSSDPLLPDQLNSDGRIKKIMAAYRSGNKFYLNESLDASYHIPVVSNAGEVSDGQSGSLDDEVNMIANELDLFKQRIRILRSRFDHLENKGEVVLTPKAPKPIGPYSQAIKTTSRNLVFLSGCIGIDPSTGKLVQGGIREETIQSLKNMESILLEAGSSWDRIHKVTIFTTDLKQFSTINEIYSSFFKKLGIESFPARSTIEVAGLPLGAIVEIEAIATYKPRE